MKKQSVGFKDGWNLDQELWEPDQLLQTPSSDKMQKELNLKVKFRESFRPFAPSVLREDVKLV